MSLTENKTSFNVCFKTHIFYNAEERGYRYFCINSFIDQLHIIQSFWRFLFSVNQRFGSRSGSGSRSGGSGTFLEQLEAEVEALLKD